MNNIIILTLSIVHNFLALSSFIYIAIEIMWFFLWEDKRLQTKYKQDTGKHPYLYCCQPFSLNIKILVNNILSYQVALVDLPKFGDDNVDDVDEYKMDRYNDDDNYDRQKTITMTVTMTMNMAM